VSYRTRANGVTALNVEFVAKPQETYRLHSAIPAAMERTLGEVTGFCGCLLLISDHEARLVTVITFWSGEDRSTRCAASAPWVQKLLSPYMDHCLSVRSLDAYWPNEAAQVDFLSGQLRADTQRQQGLALCVS